MALAISGYGAISFNASLASRAGAVGAEAADGGGQPGGVAMARDGTIIKPVSIPASPLPDRTPIRYKVKAADTLESIAGSFGLSLREITWSNPGLRLPLKTGQVLNVPPVRGVVAVVKPGDSAASLAAAYGVDVTDILGFNHLQALDVTPGLMLVIPIDPLTGPNLSTGLPADPLDPRQLVCPIKGAPIIQKFGPTSFAVEPSYGGYLHFHSGIDLLAVYGTPILAAAGGKVTAVGYADLFGLRVQITDSYGLVEIYAHMSDVSVAVGQPVQQGQRVGSVGSTGLSVGSHLHLQLEVGGVPSDPMPLIGCQ